MRPEYEEALFLEMLNKERGARAHYYLAHTRLREVNSMRAGF